MKEIPIKSEKEIEIMRQGGKILAQILKEIVAKIRSNITTEKIENYARKLFKKYKIKPSFKGYKNYPAACCISVNQEWVHGIPGRKILKKGDIVSIDIGGFFKGFHTDIAETVEVGEIKKKDRKLINATHDALCAGIKQARKGKKIGDISAAIEDKIENLGFSAMREYSGHGIGKNVHELPDIPCYGEKNTGPEIKKGMVLAIEPMASAGDHHTKVLSNGWTVVPRDKSKTAHFEHTVAVTAKGPEILTR